MKWLDLKIELLPASESYLLKNINIVKVLVPKIKLVIDKNTIDFQYGLTKALKSSMYSLLITILPQILFSLCPSSFGSHVGTENTISAFDH